MTRQRNPFAPTLLVSALTLFAVPGLTAAQATRLGAEFQVSSYTFSYQFDSAVAAEANGDFVVIWTSFDQDGSSHGIFGRRFTSAGTALSTDFQINTVTGNNQFGADVGGDADGDFVVAWRSNLQDGAPGAGVFARRYSSSGAALAAEFQANTYTVGSQVQPAVAIDAAGGFVIAWQSYGQDGNQYGIFARRFSGAGTPLATEFQVNTYTNDQQLLPAAASDADGDFVVVWQSIGQDGSGSGIFSRRFSSSGAALATEFQANTRTVDSQAAPQVTLDADGDFVVAWQGNAQDGSERGVFAQRFASSGTRLAGEFQVNAFTIDGQLLPRLASQADGDFVVTWSSVGQDSQGYGVFGRAFSSSGVARSAEFQVNTFFTGNQPYSSVATSASGAFVVAWHSDAQDGSYTGVFAQRFVFPLSGIDVDGNGKTEPLTDGLLMLRYLFGFRGATLITGAVDLVGCTRCDAPSIEAYIAAIGA